MSDILDTILDFIKKIYFQQTTAKKKEEILSKSYNFLVQILICMLTSKDVIIVGLIIGRGSIPDSPW